jgi:hypothetical protein
MNYDSVAVAVDKFYEDYCKLIAFTVDSLNTPEEVDFAKERMQEISNVYSVGWAQHSKKWRTKTAKELVAERPVPLLPADPKPGKSKGKQGNYDDLYSEEVKALMKAGSTATRKVAPLMPSDPKPGKAKGK